MGSEKATQQYLERYAEPQLISRQLQNAIEPRDFALVIPAYKEHFDFIEQLSLHPEANRIRLILVLNEPETDKGNSENKLLITRLEKESHNLISESGLRLFVYQKLQILCLLRTEQNALPPKKGVGLARKTGADLACRLHAMHKIRFPWLFSSDADTTLSESHFDVPFEPHVSAYYYGFRHIGAPGTILDATKAYEKCLHYFVHQLKKAGSPYAFPTLGSAMLISMRYYCQARGFPKRAGGEDFYLFNKLAKLAPVHSLVDREVLIQARVSDRVPFGTGPAVASIIEKTRRQLPVSYYSPEIFIELRRVLTTVPESWRDIKIIKSKLSTAAWQALTEAGFETFLLKRQVQDKTVDQFSRHFHHWFDGFQTLKFIHRLQSNYPDQPIEAIS